MICLPQTKALSVVCYLLVIYQSLNLNFETVVIVLSKSKSKTDSWLKEDSYH